MTRIFLILILLPSLAGAQLAPAGSASSSPTTSSPAATASPTSSVGSREVPMKPVDDKAAKKPAPKTSKGTSKKKTDANTAPEVKQAPAPSAASVLLSQRKVAELVLKQSDAAVETNLRADLPRFDYVTALGAYDWAFVAETGYQMSRAESLAGTRTDKEESYISSMLFTKPWITGTRTTLSWNRNSLQSEYIVTSNPLGGTLPPPRQTEDVFGFTVEQNLWRNSFGVSDRAKVRAANETLNAAVMTRANNLQDNVLTGLIKYWDSFVAEENFKEALDARERYRKLADNVRRKTGYGYSAPGELSQIRSELETKEQAAKRQSFSYLFALDDLLIYLGIPAGTPVVFEEETVIPKPPVLPKVELENLRQFQAQQLRLKAAQENAAAAESGRDPNLSLVGRMYSSGIEERANDALAESFSGSRPKYYVGVKFEMPFGSDLLNETYVNKKILARIEELSRDRLMKKLDLDLADQERKVVGLYAVVQSLGEEKTLREKAMQEINRAYTQGRIDIRQTIESLNAFSAAKINYSRALGDYQIALARLASTRDELIPNQKEGRQ